MALAMNIAKVSKNMPISVNSLRVIQLMRSISLTSFLVGFCRGYVRGKPANREANRPFHGLLCINYNINNVVCQLL